MGTPLANSSIVVGLSGGPSQVIGDITSLFQLRSFWVALTSVCPNKDELVVQSNKNSKAAVFFAAFFCLYSG